MTDKYSDDDKRQSSDKNPDAAKSEGHDPTRRKFLKNTGIAAGGVVGGSLLGGFLTDQFTSETDEKATDNKQSQTDYPKARQFFMRLADFHVLAAASERILPKDDNGPGAVELHVPYYIDKQLAGQWGKNASDYRQGPFAEFKQVESMKGKKEESQPTNPPYVFNKTETDLQRHQSRMTRGEIMIDGLRKMDQESQQRFDTTFDEANEDQQTKILQDMQSGDIQMSGVAAQNFFVLLRTMTLEGAFSDPLYGGNRDMEGWKMKEFPGAQTSYKNIIEKDEFVNMKPVSLTTYQNH
ncbi:gluconate 2-dehydrogenase subunit 3 family protein [Barrientosiimonas marina]|uniref:Gluconate 2-dehydrogenase subunit 3 family protein n=1 Tax=Lentibacillus kimchii TaxID=1542911 RepID=A0ABW2UT73_9BACI